MIISVLRWLERLGLVTDLSHTVNTSHVDISEADPGAPLRTDKTTVITPWGTLNCEWRSAKTVGSVVNAKTP